LCDVSAEQLVRVLRQEQVESDLDVVALAEQHATFGGDELVAESRVRLRLARAQHLTRPAAAPWLCEERRTRAEWPADQRRKRSPQGIAAERSRRVYVPDVDIATESGHKGPSMAVLERPVNEHEAARGANVARRLPEIRGKAILDGAQRETLGQIRVPERIVGSEGGAGSEHDPERLHDAWIGARIAWAGGRQRGE
jgi:hypothetical protein